MFLLKEITKSNLAEKYHKEFGEAYAEKTDFKFLVDLLDIFPGSKISAEFPDSLMTCFYDLIYEIVCAWYSEKFDDFILEKLSIFLEDSLNKGFDEYYINIMFSIMIQTNFLNGEINKLICKLKTKTKDCWKKFKAQRSVSL